MNGEAATNRDDLYRKISVLSERSVRIIHVLADELLKQERTATETIADQDISRQERQKIIQDMMEMREKSVYPADFDYKKVLEEALEEKYGRLA